MAIQQGTDDLTVRETAPERQVEFAPPAQPYAPERRGSLVFPVILIALGVIFLFNNMGLLSWSVWEFIWRLWPLLLVAVGLDLLLGRRYAFGSLIVAVLLLVALGGALLIWAYQPIGGQALTSQVIGEPLQGATRADVEIEFGAGTLRIGALSESDELIAGSVSTGGGYEVTRDFRVEDNTAFYKLQSEAATFFPFSRWDDARWDLRLNPEVPTSLKVDTGVGNSYLDLKALSLTSLDVNGGAGDTELTLPARGSLKADIDAGLGDVTVDIPHGMAARIDVDSGLGQVKVLGNFSHEGDTYVSPGYDKAEDRVELDVNGGIGEITIRETDAK